MKLQRIIFSGFDILLIYFLCEINIIPTVPSYSYGDFSVLEEKQFNNNIEQEVEEPAQLADASPLPNTIFFTGDVLLARNIETLMRRYSNDYPFQGFDFNDFDFNPYVLANFEASVPENHVQTKAEKMNFSVDANLLQFAKKYGFSHFSLANNHSFDYGIKGLENTKIKLSENGYVPFGLPNTLNEESITYLQMDNKTVAVVGIQAIGGSINNEELTTVFSTAESRSDWLIAYIHWGNEYQTKHSPTQEELAKQLVAAGADLIIGSHPHVVQDIGMIDNVPVFYSLGNYIFDQYFSDETQEGLVLRLNFSFNPVIQLIPVSSKKTMSQPNIMPEIEYLSFLHKLALESDAELANYIEHGMVPLDMSFATSSKMAIMSQ